MLRQPGSFAHSVPMTISGASPIKDILPFFANRAHDSLGSEANLATGEARELS